NVQLLASSLSSYAARNGRWPAHTAELLTTGLGASNFTSAFSSTVEADIPIGDTNLDRLQYAPLGRQREAVQAAATALPPGTIAHRVGDYVFTYHGMSPTNPDPGLWIVVLSPDPDSVAALPNAPVPVGFADGTARPLYGSFTSNLVAQNSLRATHGLPPLPDPATITHTSPATAP
ncbi:MAG: hypothetical protein L0Y44_12645, partial [Phycisphaerales bacterium]|nr:hypothetical protein [Phycisphaerales bacterium]